MPPAPLRSAPSCWWQVRASWVLFRWELLLARNLWALFNFSSQLGCPPRSENFPQTRQREGFLVVGNFLYWDSLPGTGLRPSFSCVPFQSLIFLSYLPSKTMGCFSGRLMSSASDQKLFCKLCSPFCCSFKEFVEEKVISPSYSSAILTPPYAWTFPHFVLNTVHLEISVTVHFSF